MKQVINVTLGGIVFAIEQDAFSSLEEYLQAIKARLQDTDDQADVVSDIERAMAEKYLGLGRSEKIAITVADVAAVRSEMGEPADFGETETTVENAEGTYTKRRLFRDTDDAVLAGVASGIARYFDIDPVLVRIGFVLSIFLNGIGIIAYLILWLVVPAAATTAERYAMQGKRVTLEELTDKVKKNLKESDVADVEYVRSVWQSMRGIIHNLFTLLGRVMRGGVEVLRVLVGVMFVIGGALTAAGLISAYSVVLLSEKTFLPLEAQEAVTIMLGNTLGIIAIVSSFIMTLIPLLVVIMLGVSLLKKHNVFSTNKAVTLAVVWIIALVLAGTTSALQVEKVWQAVGDDLDGEVELIIDEDGVELVRPSTPDPSELPGVPQPFPEVPAEKPTIRPIEDQIMCTMDVRECPDGSYVSRQAPNCEFAACPAILE